MIVARVFCADVTSTLPWNTFFALVAFSFSDIPSTELSNGFDCIPSYETLVICVRLAFRRDSTLADRFDFFEAGPVAG